MPSLSISSQDSLEKSQVLLPEKAFHINGAKRIAAAVGLSLLLFLSALDAAIVAVALPQIGQDLHNYQKTSWVASAYSLTYIAFVPIFATLMDIVGRRPYLIGAALFFAAWSAACGGAQNIIQLIVFRAFQGVGGSAIFSGVIMCVNTIVPKAQVPTFSSIIGVVYTIANIAGPILGGLIAQKLHWSWIFWVNLPTCAFGVVLIWWSFDGRANSMRPSKEILSRIDWAGSLCVLAFSLMLCTPLQLGGTAGYPWTSAAVLEPLLLSFVFLPLLLWVETKHPEPIIQLRLFRSRNIAITTFYGLCSGAGISILCFYLPQRMQVLNGFGSLDAGLRMVPLLTVTSFVAALIGITFQWFNGFRVQMWIGTCTGAIGAGFLAALKVDSPLGQQYVFQALVGFSFGITVGFSGLITQLSAPRHEDFAPALGILTFNRIFGEIIGIAISAALINSLVNSAIDRDGLPAEILVAPEQVLRNAAPPVVQLVRQTYSLGYSRSFIAATAFFTLGAIASFGLQHEVPVEFLYKQASDSEATIALIE